MAVVFFYEKPGCINNTKQKRLLEDAGHTVVAIDLLKVKWAPQRLRAFFGERPVAEWFNRSAPQVGAGEVVPEAMGEQEALAAMVVTPLLIRRPLMQIGEARTAGFNQEEVALMLEGISPSGHDLESCPRAHAGACDEVLSA